MTIERRLIGTSSELWSCGRASVGVRPEGVISLTPLLARPVVDAADLKQLAADLDVIADAIAKGEGKS